MSNEGVAGSKAARTRKTIRGKEMDGNTTGRMGALNAEGNSSVGGIGRVRGKAMA